MSVCALLPQEQIAVRAANQAIQQSVPMHVTDFSSSKPKADTAQPMPADTDIRLRHHEGFQFANRAETAWAKQRRGAQQHRVEYLGRAMDGRKPLQLSNDEIED